MKGVNLTLYKLTLRKDNSCFQETKINEIDTSNITRRLLSRMLKVPSCAMTWQSFQIHKHESQM